MAKPDQLEGDPFGIVDENYIIEGGAKVLLYGDPGSGKTTLACTFPNPLVADYERGLMSVRKMGGVLRLPKSPKLTLSTVARHEAALATIKAELKTKAPRFKTVVVDSLNSVQNVFKKNVREAFPNSDRNLGTNLTQPDYLKLMDDFLGVVEEYLNLPCNVVFTCTTKSREWEDDKKQPKFVGKETAIEIMRVVDLVGYCFTRTVAGKTEYFVNFKDSETHAGKDRFSIAADGDIVSHYNNIFGL